jgi:LCP family protein required for cell wall assembly
VAAFHEVDKIVNALELNPELKLGQEHPRDHDPGTPQTLLILGSDRRPKNNARCKAGARSDTIMLVRLDPSKEATAIMSLPRDLKVNIPGHGVDKINAVVRARRARSSTLDTVKQLTGLPINHVINVTFKGFWRAVNAVGCVYADVDHDYFNASAEFTYINVDPGLPALVRSQGAPVRALPPLRHGPRPIGAPAGLPAPDEAAGHVHGPDLEARPAGEDLRPQHRDGRGPSRRSEVLRLLKLAVFSGRKPIQEIHFEGEIGPSFVEASNAQVKKLVQRFLDVKESPGRAAGAGRAPARKPKRRQRRSPSRSPVRRVRDRQGPGAPGRPGGAGGSLPVFYPTLLLNSSQFAQPPRVYKLMGTTEALRRVPHGRPPHERVGEYYGSRAPPGRTRRSSTAPPRRARSAAASSSCSSPATGSGWWPGRPRRPPTGSRTRCFRRSTRSR